MVLDLEFLSRNGFGESDLSLVEAIYNAPYGGVPATWFEFLAIVFSAVLFTTCLPRWLFNNEERGFFGRLTQWTLFALCAPLLVYVLPIALQISNIFILPANNLVIETFELIVTSLISTAFWKAFAQVMALFLIMMVFVLRHQAREKENKVEFNFSDYCLCVSRGFLLVLIMLLATVIAILLVFLVYYLFFGIVAYAPIVALAGFFFVKVVCMHVLGCLFLTTPQHFAICMLGIFCLILFIGLRKNSKRNKLNYG